MNTNPILCPGCGSELADKARFCRKCGTNLQIINQALRDSHTGPMPLQPARQAEGPLKELRQDIFWIAIRGIITVVIALPFFFLLIPNLIATGGILTLLLFLVLLAFIVLGIRDLSRAYSAFTNPEAALAALKAQKGQNSPETKGELLESPVEHEVGINEIEPPCGSISEHTTFPLEDSSKKPDGVGNEKVD